MDEDEYTQSANRERFDSLRRAFCDRALEATSECAGNRAGRDRYLTVKLIKARVALINRVVPRKSQPFVPADSFAVAKGFSIFLILQGGFAK